MQIPESLPPFHTPTLVAVTDSQQAIFYLGTDRLFEKIKEVKQNEGLDIDPERYSMYTPDGTHSGAYSERTAMVAREKFYDELSELLRKECQTHEVTSLIICVPEEHENELKETIHGDLLKRTELWIPKNLVQELPLDILEHIAHEKEE